MMTELEAYRSFLVLDRGLSPLTVDAYVADCAQADLFFEDRAHCLASATKGDLRDYLLHLSKEEIGAKSRNRKLSALRLFFTFLRLSGKRTDDPTDELESAKTPKRLPRTLSLQEVEALFNAPLKDEKLTEAQRMRDALVIRLLYAAGLRVSELAKLALNAIDTETGMVRIHGKGDKTRLVPLDAGTTMLLKHYCRESRPFFAKGTTRDELLLTQQTKAFTRQGIWTLIRYHARLAGLSPLPSPHVIRHAFATHLLQGGMSLRTLQLLLGHADISTTEIYSHVNQEHLRDVLLNHHPRVSRGAKR